MKGWVLSHSSLCLGCGQGDWVSGLCGCRVLGWEDRAHVVTREATHGAHHIAGFDQTAGQGGKTVTRVEEPSDLLCNWAI